MSSRGLWFLAHGVVSCVKRALQIDLLRSKRDSRDAIRQGLQQCPRKEQKRPAKEQKETTKKQKRPA